MECKEGAPDKYRGSLLLDIMPHLCTHFTPYSEYLRLYYSVTEAKILEKSGRNYLSTAPKLLEYCTQITRVLRHSTILSDRNGLPPGFIG